MHNKAFRRGPRFVVPISAATMMVAASTIGVDLVVNDRQVPADLPVGHTPAVEFNQEEFYSSFPQPKKAVG